MRKIKLFLTALAVMISSVAFAQKLTVTGNVTDASNGEPVIGGTVHEKGTMNGVTTDIDGNYSISVPKNAILVFSSIGYQTTEILVDGRAQINCELPTDAEVLESAVAVGYGSAKKVGTMVGSVTTVKSEALANAPSSSALDVLQGQVAGLAVMTTGGVAGDNNVSMTLHGVGSLGSSSTPLYIIDGVQASSSAIMSMNPNDIASISILKDASATSIYGSRAANGVVFVTTKAGAYNSRATVTVRSQAGISTLADFTMYKNMMSGPELKDFLVRSGLMTPQQIYDKFTSKGWDANTEWYKYFQQFNNPQFQNDVSVEGGGDKVAYMIGASQFHQRGTAFGNFYDRYTVRSNVQGRPKDWLKVGMNVAFSMEQTAGAGFWGNSGSTSNNTYGGLSYVKNPLIPAVDENGNVPEMMWADGDYNTRYLIDQQPQQTDYYNLLGSFNVEIEPFKNFKIASRAGIDAYTSRYGYTLYPSADFAAGSGSRQRSSGLGYAATITNTIEYSFNIANAHNISLLAGHEGVANYAESFSASSDELSDDRLLNLQNGSKTTFDISESMSQSRFLSFFGRVDYSLLDRYYFDASIRNDACSRFGVNNRNATFWAVGGMWKIKNEDFLYGVSAINDLNLKVSYGTQGNASIGDYQHLGLVTESGKYMDASTKFLVRPQSPNLTWENQALLTIGVNGRIFNRFDFNIEFYDRTTTSMLMDVPYNYTTGVSSLKENVGSLSNRGVDITLGVDILQGKDYYLRASTTFNYNSEKVTSLFNGLDRWEITGTGIAYVVGKPQMFYAPIYAGIDPADGAPMWYLPGDNVDVTTMNETTKKFDEATLTQNTGKRYTPPVYGGFSIGGGWRGFSLQADFSYVLGKTLINNDGYFTSNPNVFAEQNYHKGVADFWTPENTDAKYPDWSKGYKLEMDTHLYEDASFLRLKNLQVAYSLPKRFLAGQNVLNGFKVTFTGRNLLTATKYSGIDPEVNSNLSLGRLGNSKQYLFGVELTF
ncbi:MAG: SusC/RagA family TonB-linked outer membrane protein [Bacteroidales bacterium]|nr:SusC/RagA family TonB-linked outer membrane protein [Bacteroidales bacterium]